MLGELIERIKGKLAVSGQEEFPLSTLDSSVIRGYNATRLPSARGTFCHAPGVNMLFKQDGKVNACCHNTGFTLGEYPLQSINEIWNSAAANELRAYMKNYDLGHGCGICAADMETGSYEEVRARHFDSLPRQREYPSMMEFLISNTCNFECVMCKGEFSSLIRKNREKLPPLVTPYDQEFIRQLEEFVPHLSEVRFSGSGEAFAIDMNYEIWEMIIRLNPSCIIMIQTNGSFLNARIKDLLSRGNFRIGVSLDSLQKENLEAIRIHSDFNRVMENIQYFSEYSRSKNEKFALAMCVMRQNWHELHAFINFCNANNAVATLHKVWFPSEYALNNLTVVELSAIHAYLSKFDFPVETTLQLVNRRHYYYILSVIKKWTDERFAFILEELDAVGIMDEDRLFGFFEDKISRYLGPAKMPAEEHRELVSLCMDKIRRRFAEPFAKLRSIYEMNEEELFAYLETRMEDYLNTSGMPQQDIKPVLDSCMDKVRTGFTQYGDDTGRLKALRTACIVSVKNMVNSLTQNAVTELVEQSKT